MANNAKQSSAPAKRAKPKLKKASKAVSEAASSNAAAKHRFVADLLVRGEAEARDVSGKLPLQATHEIKKLNPDGTAEVKRVRYKLY